MRLDSRLISNTQMPRMGLRLSTRKTSLYVEERRVHAEQIKLSFRLLRLVGSADVVKPPNNLIVTVMEEVSGKSDDGQTGRRKRTLRGPLAKT
jgi:hypothetical protein